MYTAGDLKTKSPRAADGVQIRASEPRLVAASERTSRNSDVAEYAPAFDQVYFARMLSVQAFNLGEVASVVVRAQDGRLPLALLVFGSED